MSKMSFNIKSDSYEDYQSKLMEAAGKLYEEGKISSEMYYDILQIDNMEFPDYADDRYSYYSIDRAPKYCAEMLVQLIKADSKPKKKKGFNSIPKEKLEQIAYTMKQMANRKIEEKIINAILGKRR